MDMDDMDRQTGMKLAGIAKCEQLARMGDRGNADLIASLLGCIPQSELGGLYGPAGSRAAIWDGNQVTMVEFHDDEIVACDGFTPDCLPALDDESARTIADIPVGQAG